MTYEAQARLPIIKEDRFDVVVIGGGISGAVAAIAAARTGSRTALIEQNAFLGGTSVSAGGMPLLGFHNKERQFVVRGIGLEIVQHLQKIGAASEFYFDPIVSSFVVINGHWLKVLLMELMVKNGVSLYLKSTAVGTYKNGKRLTAINAVTRGGVVRVEGKAFVDATDAADVAVQTGVRYIKGRLPDGQTQVASFCIRVGNLDFTKLIAYLEQHPDQIRPFPLPKETLAELLNHMRLGRPFITGGMSELVARAVRDGVKFPRDIVVGVWFPSAGEAFIVASRVEDVDPTDPWRYAKAEMEGQLQIKEIMAFIRNYLPGGENARLLEISHQIGVRETRHIIGYYLLTLEDLMNGKQFADRIALGAYHVDIHPPDNRGLASFRQPPTYSIPYRSLLPVDVDGLLVAGRCISATHEAQASTRVIPICMAIGHAAGVAASLAASLGICPHEVDVRAIQQTLLAQDAELGQGIWGIN